MTATLSIADIQHGDNSIYATVNGRELEFTGGEEVDYGQCHNCGQRAEQSQGDDVSAIRVLYWSTEAPQLCLCSDCLPTA